MFLRIRFGRRRRRREQRRALEERLRFYGRALDVPDEAREAGMKRLLADYERARREKR